MKKYLFFMFVIAFSASLTAQTKPSLNSSDVSKVGLEAVSKEKTDMEGQIINALKKENNPETAASMAKKSGGSDSRSYVINFKR
jgi:hypothetical protein